MKKSLVQGRMRIRRKIRWRWRRMIRRGSRKHDNLIFCEAFGYFSLANIYGFNWGDLAFLLVGVVWLVQQWLVVYYFSGMRFVSLLFNWIPVRKCSKHLTSNFIFEVNARRLSPCYGVLSFPYLEILCAADPFFIWRIMFNPWLDFVFGIRANEFSLTIPWLLRVERFSVKCKGLQKITNVYCGLLRFWRAVDLIVRENSRFPLPIYGGASRVGWSRPRAAFSFLWYANVPPSKLWKAPVFVWPPISGTG